MLPEVDKLFGRPPTYTRDQLTYMDADEFNAWWAQDAAKLARVVQKIGKVEGAP